MVPFVRTHFWLFKVAGLVEMEGKEAEAIDCYLGALSKVSVGHEKDLIAGKLRSLRG